VKRPKSTKIYVLCSSTVSNVLLYEAEIIASRVTRYGWEHLDSLLKGEPEKPNQYLTDYGLDIQGSIIRYDG